MIYSLDSCTLILLFAQNYNVRKKFLEKDNEKVQMLIPPMAYYEVLRGYLNVGATKKTAQLRKMYENSYKIIQIPENDVMEKGAEIFVELKKKGFTVGSNDIIIAAWTMLTGSILVTDNTKDFKNIDGLKIENWKE
ncbi:MAG: PIN domain-containing protein [Oscillospiraceae bacterium]|nr:PIN domain-containing protein [Oscillospiraceae bacterium]